MGSLRHRLAGHSQAARIGRNLAVGMAALALGACGFDTQTTTSSAPGPLSGSQNSPPAISGTPPSSGQEARAYFFQPSASDPNGDALTFQIANKPPWATFDAVSGALSGTPAAGQAGTYGNIRISVTDSKVTVSLNPFGIVVDPASGSPPPANSPPTISGTPPTRVTAGQAYAFQPSASDPNGNTLTFTVSNKPSWAVFRQSTGRLSGSPGAGDVGTFSGITIAVSDGEASASLGTFAITVDPLPNSRPVIGGNPPTSVTADSGYSFTPAASDPDGDPLSFSIQNKPAWAAFDIATGTLSGTPGVANVGAYPDVVISVSDGSASASLTPFSLAVVQLATGSATVSWTSPTANTNGSALTNLAGHRIYYGTDTASLTEVANVPGAGITSHVVSNLTPGTWYFVVRAYNADGVESDSSGVASKTIL